MMFFSSLDPRDQEDRSLLSDRPPGVSRAASSQAIADRGINVNKRILHRNLSGTLYFAVTSTGFAMSKLPGQALVNGRIRGGLGRRHATAGIVVALLHRFHH
jgi:hypothetical protein